MGTGGRAGGAPPAHRRRGRVGHRLRVFGAVEISGARWRGKTWTPAAALGVTPGRSRRARRPSGPPRAADPDHRRRPIKVGAIDGPEDCAALGRARLSRGGTAVWGC